MQTKSALLPVIFFALFFFNIDSYAINVTADTLVQPDTTSVKSDTSEIKNSSFKEIISLDFTNRLKSQLNLSEEQTGQVRSKLAGYIENQSSKDSTNGYTGEEISKLLDDTQRSSWETIKDSFWSDLNRRVRETLD
jgi:ribosomal protein S17E